MELLTTVFSYWIGVDRQVNGWFYVIHEPLAVNAFLGVTMLGEAVFVIILSVIISLLLWHWRKKWQTFALWVVVVGSGICTQIAKLIFHRARPSDALLLEHSASFPSGHATIAIAFYGFLAYLLLREMKKYRALTLVVSIIIILAIGFSRLYLGVHYLSDVLAGYLVGAVWLLIGIKVESSVSHRVHMGA